ncbi:MAG: glycosyltransferase family 4 protein [Victivallales bacterium]|nr:glycosyltransferase family 4 protein [Victivallales bacterium]
MIKIGVFTTDFNIHQIVLWRLINALEGYSVKIYVFTYDPKLGKADMETYAALFGGLDFAIIPSTRGKIRLPQKFLAREKLDVAVLYDYWYHFERQIVREARKHKYKVILHTMVERIIDLHKKSESFFANFHLRWCFTNIDAFCLLGYTAKWRLSSLGVPPEKIFLAPNVIDEKLVEAQKALYSRSQIREELDIGQSDIVFLLYHDWMNDRQATSLMRAMCLLKDYPQITLIFIGEETRKQKIYDLLHNDFKGRLIIAGRCSSEKSSYYFCASDIFVMSASKYYWGDMGNMALHWGLPVIINNACECGGEFVIDGYTGYSFYDNDDEALVRYMRKFITNPELIDRMRLAAVNQIQNYTAQTSAEGFIDAVNYVLRSGTAG